MNKLLQNFDPNALLDVMNTYRRVLPEGSILAQNRRGSLHVIIPRHGRNQRATFTSHACLVRFLDQRLEGTY